MKFLLNMNLPRELGKRLHRDGHAYRHAADIGLSRAEDTEIIREAVKSKEVILTHDLDYGDLLAFSGDTEPSVVIFRVVNTHVDNLFRCLVSRWNEIEKPLQQGAIVIIEDAAFRIRELPVERGK